MNPLAVHTGHSISGGNELNLRITVSITGKELINSTWADEGKQNHKGFIHVYATFMYYGNWLIQSIKNL